MKDHHAIRIGTDVMRNLKRTDGRARFYMLGRLGIVDWPRQMRMLSEGTIPFALLNGSDDPFLNHAYIARLKYGNLWRGSPQGIDGGRHAPFFNAPDAFNLALFAFLNEADEMQGRVKDVAAASF